MATIGPTQKLAQFAKRMQARLRQNVETAGAMLLAEALIRTPIDVGNLRGSSDIVVTGGDARPFCHVYYTAAYAVFVHEDLQAHHEVGQAKFLLSAAQDLKGAIKATLAEGIM